MSVPGRCRKFYLTTSLLLLLPPPPSSTVRLYKLSSSKFSAIPRVQEELQDSCIGPGRRMLSREYVMLERAERGRGALLPRPCAHVSQEMELSHRIASQWQPMFDEEGKERIVFNHTERRKAKNLLPVRGGEDNNIIMLESTALPHPPHDKV